MADIAYVQKESVPPSPPPAGKSGAAAWAKENLFDGWFNSALTLASLALIAWMLPGIVQWAFVDAVWFASSLQECRELGEGACWAVIVERFDQFIYGFYPSELRWRPNLAFILLFVALAPVLFDNVPYRAQGMIFSAVYPVVAYWLIWGGSIWGPAMFVAGFALIGVASTLPARFGIEGGLWGLAAAAVAAVLWFLGPLMGWATSLFDAILPFVALEPVESRSIGGFLLGVIIGVAGIAISLPFGILLALGRRSNLIFIQTLSVVFIEFIRGVPLITLLFVASVMLSYFFPPGTTTDLFLRVVIMITMFSSAYIAEVIRGGLAALPRGQYEAADSLGLDYPRSIR
ncbi:MAG: ABC transporter permease subunit [Pseudomonadota bacterium]